MAALALLKELPLEGAIVTGDAIFCQREICRTITDGHGDYLFVVKDNQPELKADIAESFGDLSPLGAQAAHPPTCRLTWPRPRRPTKATAASRCARLPTSAEVVEHLGWPGAAQVARIERTRWIGDKVSTEVAYLVTSLPAAKAGPERLLALSRGHWAIENRLHYVRDVSMEEDRWPRARRRPRTGRAAQSRAPSHPRPRPIGARGPRELPRGPRPRHCRRNRPDSLNGPGFALRDRRAAPRPRSQASLPQPGRG